MEAVNSLKEVERRAYRATFEDGFYEMAWAGLFLIFAWIPVLESAGISRFYCYPFILISAVIPWLGRRYVTIPRLGAVEFGEKRKARKRITALIGAAAIVLMLPLIVMMAAEGLPGGVTWGTAAIMAAPLIAIGVFFMDYSRMYIYGLLFLFSILASEFLRNYISIQAGGMTAFGVPGIAILCFGIILLVKFLKGHPKPSAEGYDASR